MKHNHQQASSSISEDDDDLIQISGLDAVYPRTAPPTVTNHQQSRFTFDAKGIPCGRFEDSQTSASAAVPLRRSSGKFIESSSSSSSSPSSVSANTVTIVSPSTGRGGGGGGGGCDEDARNRKETHPRFASPNGNNNNINSGLSRVVFRDKSSSKKRINSAPLATSGNSNSNSKMDNTMFPFDREAIDYDRIRRECFAVDEVEEAVRHYPFLDLDTDPDSPVYEKPTSIFHSPSKSPYRRSVHESNEMTERCRYNAAGQGNSPDDIFRQYALFSQQEKSSRDRRSPSMKRAKGSPASQQSHQSDAFSPKPAKARHSPGNCEQEESFIAAGGVGASVSPSSTSPGTVLKFDQINSKFEQTSPNQKRTSNCYNSNGNLSGKSVNALSPTLHHGHHHQHHNNSHHHYAPDPNLSPTIVRITPPLPDLRVDYFNLQQQKRRSDEEDEEDVDDDLNETETGCGTKKRHSLSRNRRKNSKSPDRYSCKTGGSSHHSRSQYHAMMLSSKEEGGGGGGGDDDQKTSRGSGGGGEAAGVLDDCQKNAQQLRSINVTPNPMDGPVCTQPPRATIVVQQVNKRRPIPNNFAIIF